MYVCLPFWTGRAALNVGVIGETGGRTGDADRDFEVDVGECPSGREVLVGDVSTVRDGMVCREIMGRHAHLMGMMSQIAIAAAFGSLILRRD